MKEHPLPGNDLVVVVPGILGTALHRDGRPVWDCPPGGAVRAVANLHRSLPKLRLADDLGGDHPGDGVEPGELMPSLHALPGVWTPTVGYTALLERLRRLGYRDTGTGNSAAPGNLVTFPYDWRLSHRYNAQRLADLVATALGRWRARSPRHADARAVLIGYSTGGLIVRWYLANGGGSELTRRAILVGAPERGAVRALAQLVNDAPDGLGRLGEDLADFARSLPSMHQLLPEYPCVDTGGAADPGSLHELPPPRLRRSMVGDGLEFHCQLRRAEAANPALRAMTYRVGGAGQPTPAWVRLGADRVECLDAYRGAAGVGDAIVPVPPLTAGVEEPGTTAPAGGYAVCETHGSLHDNPGTLDAIEEILTGHRAGSSPYRVHPRVSVPEVVVSGADLPVQVAVPEDGPLDLRVTLRDASGRRLIDRHIGITQGSGFATLPCVAAGAYRVSVGGVDQESAVAPVTSNVLVWSER